MIKCTLQNYNLFLLTSLFSLYYSVPCPPGHQCQGRCELSNDIKFCICEPGETNWDCKTPLDLCNRDCTIGGNTKICNKLLCNQGTCNNIPTPPFYTCDCGPFHTGQNCQLEKNPCIIGNSNPCGNGRCEFIYGINKVNCHCNPGWKARDSETVYTIDWEGTNIIIDPSCTEQVFYGVSKIAPYLSQGNRVVWYIIFIIILIFFIWQFYMLCITITKIKFSKSKSKDTNKSKSETAAESE